MTGLVLIVVNLMFVYLGGLKELKNINSATFIQMVKMGANHLENNRELINTLNVFPVPDGDTGTNMNLSLSSGVQEITKKEELDLNTALTSFVRGLLMGARGNSGVILSQLFRGFAEQLKHKTELSGADLAEGLVSGVEAAYQSVTEPVEGTILTVAKDAANKAKSLDTSSLDVIEVMEEVVAEAKASLNRTPDLLPVLKEVGVVDSGGKGLVVIYEGFLAALKGEALPENDNMDMTTLVDLEHERSVQSFIDKDSIEYGYCTEFFVEFDDTKMKNNPFNEAAFRSELSEYGDSLLVATDEDFVKIHIHTEYPGKVMTIGQKYGDLSKIDIENMRLQYENIVEEEQVDKQVEKEFGIVTVAMGEGLKEMFASIGATTIIEGGQTMNPSTEDLLQAVENTNATYTYIVPNNKNIVMAAEQVKSLTDKEVIIIPSRTIPQGISALFSFDGEQSKEENTENMLEAMEDVKTGSVTYAIRDTVINDIEIKKDSYMGMNDGSIVATDHEKINATINLLTKMIDEDDELVTVFYGEDVKEADIEALEEFATEELDDVEVEFYAGNQPIYSFIIMVE